MSSCCGVGAVRYRSFSQRVAWGRSQDAADAGRVLPCDPVKAVPASVARRRQKSQAIKNPKESNFAWGFSVLVVPRDGIEPPTRGFSRRCVSEIRKLLRSFVGQCQAGYGSPGTVRLNPLNHAVPGHGLPCLAGDALPGEQLASASTEDWLSLLTKTAMDRQKTLRSERLGRASAGASAASRTLK